MRMHTPLCPAGHLPHKGGDRQVAKLRRHRLAFISWQGNDGLHRATGVDADVGEGRRGISISPLVGEMPGRAEGGITRQTRSRASGGAI
ncbi:hypothetical protein E0I74_19195 [Rhizobium laguerreae]|nr:hypothetical protein E0I74_19195 [Rhizobium laguerreae]TBY01683.1 hypothetical protein E0J21_27885 [Rhizobium laguerreae]TBY14281.1 hypothetical protein E0I94_07205 [Rhizobium laguerreae]